MSNRSRIAVLLAAAAVSASAWAVGPNPPSPVSVTSYYNDAARTQLVGVSMYGDCPGANGQLIGQYGPFSDNTTVMCDDVGNVPMPF